MKISKIGKSILSVLMAVLMVAAILPMSVLAAVKVDTQALPESVSLISKTDYKIAPGIEESHLTLNNADGTRQNKAYVMTVELGGSAAILASYKDQDGTKDGMQTVRDQARTAERKGRAKKIVGGVNADIFNMATGAPKGFLIMDGVEYYHNENNQPYFAILKDGTAVIRESWESTADVKEALGLWAIIVRDGQNILGNDPGNYVNGDEPRTCLGIKADGSVVILVVDGRQYPASKGCTWAETADILISMGCVIAGEFDGGGSTTYLSRHEGSDSLSCQNSPSDGSERAVSSALLVAYNEVASGEFDHASLLPNNEIYTPGSIVNFAATGVDGAGDSAALPEDGKFVLADTSFGTITDDGKFTSNGKVGTVAVNYVSSGKICGSVSVEIQQPDEMYFQSDEVSLGFEAVTDFGLVLKYQGKEINFKDGDIKWTAVDAGTGEDCLSVIGTFNGNTLTTPDGVTVTANVTATYAGNESLSATVKAIIGMLPTVVWDFEDERFTHIDEKDENGNIISEFKTGVAGRGAIASAEVVSIYDDYPVRFGTKSLKLNYDFTQMHTYGTDGSYFGMSENVAIPGMPTGIGVWVYAPDDTANFWLRGYIYSASGALTPVDFTLQTSQATADTPAGIYWSGWKYCEADLTKIAGPYTLARGYTFRLMYVPGINMGATTKGSIYLDNLQFVYGANTDDIDLPLINSMTVNDVEIVDGVTTVNTNTVTLQTTYADVENKYTTGVQVVRMYVDGKEVTHSPEYWESFSDGRADLYEVELANGIHSLKLTVRDGFGNETTEERFFKVEGDKQYPTFTVEPTSDAPILCGKYGVKISSDIPFDTAEVTVAAASSFKNFEVKFAPECAGSKYKYNDKTNTITLSIVNQNSEKCEYAAEIVYGIPSDLLEGTTFDYVVEGYYDSAAVTESKLYRSFSSGKVRTEVKAQYIIESGVITIGIDGFVTVKDIDGNAVAGISVFNEDGSLFGTTDENGKILINNQFENGGTYKIYAEKEGFRSFVYSLKVNSVPEDADTVPYNILNVGVKDHSTQKSVTWMSNPLKTNDKAVMLIAEAAEYEEKGEKAFTEVVGETELLNLGFTYNTIRSSRVTASDLKPGHSYVYKVGDGENWSETDKFTLGYKNTDTSFFVVGDIQAADLSPTAALLNNLVSSGKKYDFSIQTGDSVDNAGNYNYWTELLNIYNTGVLGDLDTVHVMGNHEFESDLQGLNSNAIYNLNGGYPGSTYSLTYGNVYVAVINYTKNEKQLTDALEWFVNDAKQSDATWKILAMHQPSYYTNPTGGNEYINRLVPPAAEAAGVDFVFSGHDHSYARTKPLTQGAVDEANGITYLISGSTGEKSYDIVKNDSFNFAVLDDTFDICYLTIDTTDTTFDITTHSGSITTDAEGNETISDTIIDSYRKTKTTKCTLDTHNYIYDGEVLTCSACGYINFNEYTGVVTDKETNRVMYITDGKAEKNVWKNIDGKDYYLGDDGIAVTGKYTVKSVINDAVFNGSEASLEYNFDENGVLIVPAVAVVGKMQYAYWAGVKNYTGFVNKTSSNGRYFFLGDMVSDRWMSIDDAIYHFDDNGVMAKGTTVITESIALARPINGSVNDILFDGKEVDIKYVFDKEGKLVKGELVEKNDAKYYIVAGLIQFGWYNIDGDWYYFDGVKDTEYYGKSLTGNWTRNSQRYVCDSDGKLIKGFVVKDSNGTKYLWAGQAVTGWCDVDGVDWDGNTLKGTFYFDPVTYYMVTDTAVIDGEIYCFAEDGTFMHKGAHNRRFVKHVDVSCTEDGYDLYICTYDGAEHEERLNVVPSPGHIDANDDGKCDVCGKNLWSFFTRIIKFFERILEMISRLFK